MVCRKNRQLEAITSKEINDSEREYPPPTYLSCMAPGIYVGNTPAINLMIHTF